MEVQQGNLNNKSIHNNISMLQYTGIYKTGITPEDIKNYEKNC